MTLLPQISSWITQDYLAEKAQKGSWDKFRRALAKVSDQEPENYNKLQTY